MKKILPLTFPVNLQNDQVYGKGKKSDVPNENLFVPMNKRSRKVMVSTAIYWYNSTIPFFVNENNVKVNKENYCKHLKNSCFLQLKNLLSGMTGYLSSIVLCHINRVWYKISLKKL